MEENIMHVTYAKKYELFSFNEAMDNVFLQKVLPRIQGSSLALLFLASINSNIPEFNFSSTPTPLLEIHG